ncbi:MAG: HD domain-containing protein [Micavibrio sp.]
MSGIIQKAKELAGEHHAALHLYDAARTPAITHIAEVAALVETHGGTEDMIAAAWLHDIAEDTAVRIAAIERIFGPLIADHVDALTDPPHFEALPLEERKPMQAERLQGKSGAVKLIKLCDQLSNVMRVLDNPPDDWDESTQFLYIKGAKQVADCCRGACPALDLLFDTAYERACIKYGDVK